MRTANSQQHWMQNFSKWVKTFHQLDLIIAYKRDQIQKGHQTIYSHLSPNPVWPTHKVPNRNNRVAMAHPKTYLSLKPTPKAGKVGPPRGNRKSKALRWI